MDIKQEIGCLYPKSRYLGYLKVDQEVSNTTQSVKTGTQTDCTEVPK